MLPRAAGTGQTLATEGTASCMKFGERPVTPPHMRKWRKSTYAEPGQRVVHPGILDDFTDGISTSVVFGGVSVKDSDHVEDIWCTPGMDSEYSEAKYSQKESVYKSIKTQPLGKSYVRGHPLPERTLDSGFSFGKPSVTSAAAKPLIYPPVTEDEKESQAQYVKSHGSYLPGEQKRRDYTWKIDTSAHRFGVSCGSQNALNGTSVGVSKALMQSDVSRITSKKTEDAKSLTIQLGRARNLGFGSKDSHPAVYGKTSLPDRKNGEWDARACIEGTYEPEDQEPDSDLGKSMTPGFRNITTETRPFGVPSVRSDIPKYATRSIADNQNYGDDVSAQFLLYPQQFASMGIEDQEFQTQKYTKDEIFDIFSSSGCADGLTTAELQAAWNVASAISKSDIVTVEKFQEALNDLLEAKA